MIAEVTSVTVGGCFDLPARPVASAAQARRTMSTCSRKCAGASARSPHGTAAPRGVVVTYPLGARGSTMATWRRRATSSPGGWRRSRASPTRANTIALRHRPADVLRSERYVDTESRGARGVRREERPLRRRRASSLRRHQDDHPSAGRRRVPRADRLVAGVSPPRRRCRAGGLQRIRKGGRADSRTDAARAGRGAREARRRHRGAWPIRRRQRDRSRERARRDRAGRHVRDRAWSSSRTSPTSRPTASGRSAWRTASAPTTARSS